MNEQIKIIVDDELDDEPRLDTYLPTRLEEEGLQFSRSRVQKLISQGDVLVNHKIGKASLRLNGGDIIEVKVPEPLALELAAQDIPLNIVYEDSDLIVINKETGMVVHPGAGVHDGTLVNALLHRCSGELQGIGGAMRPGIVHRIDKDTSGLLVVAKTELAHTSLSSQISSKEAQRIYLALVEGKPANPSGIINKVIGRHKTDRKKMAITEVGRGRNAETHFEVLSQWSKFSLIKASLKTGRTHQIRVHMASINCPVVGDIVYNKKSTGTESARHKLGLSGHALHATYLCFRHPRSGVLLEFEAKLPDDFQKLVDSLS